MLQVTLYKYTQRETKGKFMILTAYKVEMTIGKKGVLTYSRNVSNIIFKIMQHNMVNMYVAPH